VPGAGGSNPLAPTIYFNNSAHFLRGAKVMQIGGMQDVFCMPLFSSEKPVAEKIYLEYFFELF
jgi:hypothetical protein